MNEKLKYAPGKPGFGSKGDAGIPGNQGLSMYFTDFNPVTQSTLINSRIENDYALWSGSPVLLPDGRVYITGDIFFDGEGKAYEIDASTNTFTYKFASLNMGGFFVPLGTSTDEGHARYFNSNTAPKYIIDNVMTGSGAIDYTQVPSDIYSIAPLNFTRLEYTNIKPDGQLNAFTVYSAGQVAGIDDEKALAIVYDEMNSTFRICNLDSVGNLRNVNLTFDVSVLKISKNAGNIIGPACASGTILTNYEIAANSLFDPNFNPEPVGYVTGISSITNDCSIIWTLQEFTNDPNISADLYFYQDIATYSASYKADSSILRPLIFTDVDVSGYVHITGLDPNTPYACYLKLMKNGWSRKSAVKSIFPGFLTVTPDSSIVNDYTITSNVTFVVASNITWNYQIISNPSSFMSIISSSTNGLDGSIYVTVTPNTNTQRKGVIRVIPKGGIGHDVSIWQKSPWTTLTMDLSLGGNPYPPSSPNRVANYTIKGGEQLPGNTYMNLSLRWAPSADNYATVSSSHDWNISVSAPGKVTANLSNSKDPLAAGFGPFYAYGGAGSYYSWNNILGNCTSANFPITITLRSEAHLNQSGAPYDRCATLSQFNLLTYTPQPGSMVNFIYAGSEDTGNAYAYDYQP